MWDTGVWLTQDVYRGRVEQPLTLHRTLYVLANPVNHVDAYGYRVIANGYSGSGGGSTPVDIGDSKPVNSSQQGNSPYEGEINQAEQAETEDQMGFLTGLFHTGLSGPDSKDGLNSVLGSVLGDSPPDCPLDGWDCEAVENVWKLRQSFLDSAARHNITDMDDEAFAALIAATIVSERRIGNVPPDSDPYNRKKQRRENFVAGFSIVSGHYIEEAREQKDWPLFAKYLTNQEIPEGHPIYTLASVGIGNVKLNTATNLWREQACTVRFGEEECISVQVSPLQQTQRILWFFERENDIENPFEETESYDPSEATRAYLSLSQQLLDDKLNIEYVAANLEAGALRAQELGYEPSAFNMTLWHLHGVQTYDEIERAGLRAYAPGAAWIMNNMGTALTALGVTSSWDVNQGPLQPEYGGQTEYEYWTQSQP